MLGDHAPKRESYTECNISADDVSIDALLVAATVILPAFANPMSERRCGFKSHPVHLLLLYRKLIFQYMQYFLRAIFGDYHRSVAKLETINELAYIY
jgi:hypothetical protein